MVVTRESVVWRTVVIEPGCGRGVAGTARQRGRLCRLFGDDTRNNSHGWGRECAGEALHLLRRCGSNWMGLLNLRIPYRTLVKDTVRVLVNYAH